jgi:HNH endonuclease
MNGRAWSKREEAKLRKLYPTRKTSEVARIIGRSLCATNQWAFKLGLHKTAEYKARALKECGEVAAQRPAAIRSRFPKGLVPANKGLRRPGYSIGRGRMRSTQFKPGQRSRNWLPIGGLKVVDGYLYVKISDIPEKVSGKKSGSSPNWKLLHHKVWEDAGNPRITFRTHALAFKDRNRTNCALENLELITRRELRLRNSIHRIYPADLKLAINALGALKRKLRRHDGKGNDGRSSGDAARNAQGDAPGEAQA